MEQSVSWIVFDSLNSGRGQFDTYYDRLSNVVPTPDTEIIELSNTGTKIWDTEKIVKTMQDNGWDKAFVRTMQKAAPNNIDSGSIIHEPTKSEINQTIRSLLTQTRKSDWSHGGKIALRTLLDTRFCLGDNHHMCHPEIRYIIEGGEILCKLPETVTVTCPKQYNYIQETIDNATPPDNHAKNVAEEFNNSTWAVDFVMDTHGDWYCLEMNLNGVRWSEEQQTWKNMCGYGNKTHLSPEIIHQPITKYKPTKS